MKKYNKLHIALVMILAATGCGKDKVEKQTTNSTTEITTTEVTEEITTMPEATTAVEEVKQEEDVFENPERVEYIAIARDLEGQNADLYGSYFGVHGFEWSDLDNDGNLELMAKIDFPDNDAPGGYAYIYMTLDSAAGMYSEWYTQNTKRVADILFDDEKNNVYLEELYSDYNQPYDAFNCWTEDGWQPKLILEKNGQGDEEGIWDGENVSKDEWKSRKSKLSLREMNNNLLEYRSIYTDSSVDTVIDTLEKYYNDKGMTTIILEKDDKEKYIIIENYSLGISKSKEDLESNSRGISYLSYGSFGGDFIAVARETEYGTKVFSKLIIGNYSDFYYSDGIVAIAGDEYHEDLIYEFTDDDYVIASRVNFNDIEKVLIDKDWYTISRNYDGNEVIGHLDIKEDSSLTYTEYMRDSSGNWKESDSETDTYSFNETDNSIFIFYAAAISSSYYYIDSDHIDSGLTIKNGEIDANCFVSYDSFPDYDDLKQRCLFYLK